MGNSLVSQVFMDSSDHLPSGDPPVFFPVLKKREEKIGFDNAYELKLM